MPFRPRGIEQSLVLPPRWPLILSTGTLYMYIFVHSLATNVYLCSYVHPKHVASTTGFIELPSVVQTACKRQRGRCF